MEPAPVQTSLAEPAIVDAPVSPRPPREQQPRPEKPHHAKPQHHAKPPREHGRHPHQDRSKTEKVTPEAVDKSQLPAFLFRPVPVRKPE